MLEAIKIGLAALPGDRKGIAALEYAILAAVIIGAIFGALQIFGSDIGNLFNNLAAKLNSEVT